MEIRRKARAGVLRLILILCFSIWGASSVLAQCNRTITANVVAFDQAFVWNRLGAVQPQGMMYALLRDVVPITGTQLSPGNVQLRQASVRAPRAANERGRLSVDLVPSTPSITRPTRRCSARLRTCNLRRGGTTPRCSLPS